MQVVRDTAATVVGSNSSKKKKTGEKKSAGGDKHKTEKDSKSNSSSSGAGGKGKDGKAAAGAAGEGSDAPSFVLLQDPQAAAEVALCNATGALHHLSFLDAAKAQIGASVRLELLVKLSSQTQVGLVEHTTPLPPPPGLAAANDRNICQAGGAGETVKQGTMSVV